MGKTHCPKTCIHFMGIFPPQATHTSQVSQIWPPKGLHMQDKETEDHLFFECTHARSIWHAFYQWWDTIPQVHTCNDLILSLLALKTSKTERTIIYAITAEAIYHIWRIRNQVIFSSKQLPGDLVILPMKEQIRQRILYMNLYSKKYTHYIDRLLQWHLGLRISHP